MLVNLHEAGGDVETNLVGGPGATREGCGRVNMEALQQVLAAKWAVDVINNQSLPHELNIGNRVF